MSHNLVIASNISELTAVAVWLQTHLVPTLDEKVRNNILLVAQELVTNAIIHGNQSNISKHVTIGIDIQKSGITLTIEDEGSGIKELPSKEEASNMNYLDENGRGLKLAILLSTSVIIDNNRIVVNFK